MIPLIRRFLIAGVPLSAVMAFWVASPSMDPEIYALSASQLGLPIATARLVGALVLSFGAGLIVLALERRGRFGSPLRGGVDATPTPACSSAPPPEPACAATVTARAQVPLAAGVSSRSIGTVAGAVGLPLEAPSACSGTGQAVADQDQDDGRPWRVLVRRDIRALRLRPILREIWGDSMALGKWLLLAIVLEALIVRYVPADAVTSALGAGGVASVVLAGALSVPLYLNGVGAIPVANGLLEQGMLPAAGVTFLLGGALTTVPAMVAVRSVVNNRVFAFYLGVAMIGSIGVGLVALPLL